MKNVQLVIAPIVALALIAGCRTGRPDGADAVADTEQQPTPRADASGSADTGPAEDGGVPDLSAGADVRPIARYVLAAWKDKSLSALLPLVPPAHREEMERMMAEDPARLEARAFDEDGWRMKSVASWDGKLHEVRRLGDAVRVRYADLGDLEVAVVTLRLVDGRWTFDDLHSPPKPGWMRWGKLMEAR